MQNRLPDNFLKIFGTAGARIAQSKQMRASGGAWLRLAGTNLLFDPGPGTLVHCWGSNPALNPVQLDGVLLSHRHLDHSNDFNVMVEAMVEGGLRPHGLAAAPADALKGDEPIFFHYLRPVVDRIETLAEGGSFKMGEVTVSTPLRHKHPVETYGFIFSTTGLRIAVVTDTRYFPELADSYRGADLLILNVTFIAPYHGKNAYHLSLEEVEPLIREIGPQLTVLTHFGTTIISNDPPKLAEALSQKAGYRVAAAHDGMVIDLDKMAIVY